MALSPTVVMATGSGTLESRRFCQAGTALREAVLETGWGGESVPVHQVPIET